MLMYTKTGYNSIYENKNVNHNLDKLRKYGADYLKNVTAGYMKTPKRYNIEVGDSVRIPKNYHNEIGWTGTVKKIISVFCIISSDSNNEEYLFGLDEVEKVDEKSNEVKFSKGDQVKILCEESEYFGETGEVQSISLNGSISFFVNINNTVQNRYFNENNIEHVEKTNKKDKENKNEFSEGDKVKVVTDLSSQYKKVGEVIGVSKHRKKEIEVKFEDTDNSFLFRKYELEHVEDNQNETYSFDDFEKGEWVRIIKDEYKKRGEYIGKVDIIGRHSIRVISNDVIKGFNPSELEKIDNNNEFEPGEYVKISENHPDDSYTGKTGTIERNYEKGPYVVKCVGKPVLISEKFLESVESKNKQKDKKKSKITVGDDVEISNKSSEFHERTGTVDHIDENREFSIGVKLITNKTSHEEERIILFKKDEVVKTDFLVYSENSNQIQAYIDVGKEFGYNKKSHENQKPFPKFKWLQFTTSGMLIMKTQEPPNHKSMNVYKNIGIKRLREILKDNN